MEMNVWCRFCKGRHYARIDELECHEARLASLESKLAEAEAMHLRNCMTHRCTKHYATPKQNESESSGAECGGCIAAERDAAEKKSEDYRRQWLDETAVIIRMEAEAKTLRSERDAAVAEAERWRSALAKEECDRIAKLFDYECPASVPLDQFCDSCSARAARAETKERG